MGKGNNNSSTNTSSRSKSKKKGKRGTKEETKVKKLRPADDVINRLRWDSGINTADVIVGYEDRFTGIQERGFNAFNWVDDLATLSHLAVAIPRHRIVYFKYRGVEIWNRTTRVDRIFGSGISSAKLESTVEQINAVTSGSDDCSTDDDDDDEDDETDTQPLSPYKQQQQQQGPVVEDNHVAVNGGSDEGPGVGGSVVAPNKNSVNDSDVMDDNTDDKVDDKVDDDADDDDDNNDIPL
eukprot:m.165052 g.165052  ORF g.165052 m.165052 type:complete len:238 (+) comp13432_c1_seq1:299-1012(+)